MTFFGLDAALVPPLVRTVAGEDLPDEQIEDRFARASWTGIAEPGDRVAGELVAALGPGRALASLVEGWTKETILESAAASGAEVSLDDVDAALARWRPRVRSAAAVTALRQAARFSVTLLVPGDPSWPAGLDDLGSHAPLALWLRGNESTLATLHRSIALVGARAATGYGEHVTMEASAGLVDRGYTIVSGAAYGIDGMAHRAALASSGLTVAFLAGGVDRFYPSGHDQLLTRIAESGAVVSELPCGSSPTKWRFLQRNRLIASTSRATVVLEAGWRSGSLNTAGHAATVGRPLGAVPGPVTSAASAGCHRLIREFDAVCVTSAEEMSELAPLESATPDAAAGNGHDLGAAERTRVLDSLSGRSPRSSADIAARSGLSVAGVQAVLGVLELDGKAKEGQRGWTAAKQ
jgi:DNA processing protein